MRIAIKGPELPSVDFLEVHVFEGFKEKIISNYKYLLLLVS